jgi:hypothetical protein
LPSSLNPSVWEMRLTIYLRRSSRPGSWVTWEGLKLLRNGYCRFQTRRKATLQLHPILEKDSPKFDDDNGFPGCDASFWHHVGRRPPLRDGHLVLPTSQTKTVSFSFRDVSDFLSISPIHQKNSASISTVNPTRYTKSSNLFYFGITLYMFRSSILFPLPSRQ